MVCVCVCASLSLGSCLFVCERWRLCVSVCVCVCVCDRGSVYMYMCVPAHRDHHSVIKTQSVEQGSVVGSRAGGLVGAGGRLPACQLAVCSCPSAPCLGLI